MNFIKIGGYDSYEGIALKGLDSVKEAISVYASKNIKDSTTAEINTQKTIGEDYGGLGVGLYILAKSNYSSQNTESDFVKGLLMDLENSITTNGSWYDSWEYFVPAPFHKASMRVTLIDKTEDVYMLTICMAYVGDELEVNLAKYLGTERCLLASSTFVEFEPLNSDEFEIDFDTIIPPLTKIFGFETSLSGKYLAKSFFNSDGNFLEDLFQLDDMSVSIKLRQIRDHFEYNNGTRKDTWSIHGSVLKGLLNPSYEDENKKETPQLVIRLEHNTDSKNYNARYIYKPETKKKYIDLSQNIVSEFQKLI